jgi:hypothetical protein
MGQKIKIVIGGESIPAELNDSATAALLAEKLPVTVSLSRWGDEYYGSCGVNTSLDSDAREIMEVGELAYWPPGNALCIFFGPTPASTDGRPRAASAANPIGMITGDPSVFGGFGGSITAEVRNAG